MRKEEQSVANTGWISAYSRYLCWLIVTWRPKVRRAGSNPGDGCLLHWHILCKFPHLSRIFKSRKYSPQIAFSKCFKTKSEKKSLSRYLRLKRTRLHRLKHKRSSPHVVNELFTCVLKFDVDLVFCDLSFTCSWFILFEKCLI